MFPQARCELAYGNEWELLIAIILSAQTTDEAVNRTTPALFAKFRTIRDYAQAKPEEISEFIRHLGLFQNKARYIHDTSQRILANFEGKVPATQSDLESLPGVGRKTANVYLAEWLQIPRIAVDTHVSRLSVRLGFSRRGDSPETIERQLMDAFPKNLWIDLHHKLIFFGRYFCTAKNPQCVRCPFLAICTEPVHKNCQK